MDKQQRLKGKYLRAVRGIVCRCECGGKVRGEWSFGRLFTWCEKCTPVVTVKISSQVKNG